MQVMNCINQNCGGNNYKLLYLGNLKLGQDRGLPKVFCVIQAAKDMDKAKNHHNVMEEIT